MSKKFENKLAVITGASRGIGAAAAITMAEEGAEVILVARTVGALEEMDDVIKEKTGREALLVPLDLTDYDGIDRLGGIIAEKWGKLDILVGNAGILGPISPLGHIKPEDWQNVMDVNVTANYRLLRSFDALLRAADHGRAVFVGSSTVAQTPRPYWGAYATSKAALDCLVKTYAAETENTPVNANILNPGPIRTAMRSRAVPGEDPMKLDTPYDLAPMFIDMCDKGFNQSGKIFNYKDYKANNNSF